MNKTDSRSVVFATGVVSLGILLGGLAGCRGVSPQEQQDMDPTRMAEELFTRITVADPFEDWEQFPEAQGIVPSAPPHGDRTDIRINDVVSTALDNFSGPLPDDSIIVKKNIGGEGDKVDALTVMWKVVGFNPDNNDWFWANLSLDGQVNAAGKVEGCINCHSGARGNDFVFTHSF